MVSKVSWGRPNKPEIHTYGVTLITAKVPSVADWIDINMPLFVKW
jgi:hypothetical protein